MIWLVVMGRDFDFALERTVTVMVITCPHALGLAVPARRRRLDGACGHATGCSSATAPRSRGARKLQAIIFDKTGTLTEGRFGVTDLDPRRRVSRKTMLRPSAASRSQSEHPIAGGIVAAAEERQAACRGVSRAIPGKGAEAGSRAATVKVVSPGYLREQKIDRRRPARRARCGRQGKTVVFVLVDDTLEGAIALADVIRPDRRRRSTRSRRWASAA